MEVSLSFTPRPIFHKERFHSAHQTGYFVGYMAGPDFSGKRKNLFCRDSNGDS
jgi:hypothetical protein